jgi:7-carboxy-7-deazaguanine synthase
MRVTEIFRSIQGESSFAGLPCVFVRLTGCNLRCTWCDTAYAFYEGTERSLENILLEIQSLAAPTGSPSLFLVEITGGEPLLQPQTPELASVLIEKGYTVLVETSGERRIDVLPPDAIRILDVKCPDSGEPDTFRLENLAHLNPRDEIKFVISSRRDYEFAREFTLRHSLAERVHQVLFSPVVADPSGHWPSFDSRTLTEWILTDSLPVRLNLQMHKFIWDPAMRGV